MMALIRVKSADRGIRILELLAAKKIGMQHKEIPEDPRIPEGSLTKLPADLVESRYLPFDPGSKIHKLGSRVLALANSYLSGLNIIQAAQPVVHKIVAETDESASLQVLDGNSALVVHRQHGDHPMSFRIGIGALIPLYATASGKALPAFSSKDQIDEVLPEQQTRV